MRRPTITIDGVELHYRRLGADFEDPPLVFLHEGLGSIELWRDFADEVVGRTRRRGLVFSRRGNGWSAPLSSPRTPDYMHEEGLSTLPAVLAALLGTPPILIGHSDGASIAIVYAGAGNPAKGLVLIAPHVFAEEEGLRAIRDIRRRFAQGDLVERMAKYHVDPESTFYGWADVWLSPEFRSWNIEEYLPGVDCPTLVIQGSDDQYGTMQQLVAIDAGLQTPARRLVVDDAGHSPHLTSPGPVIDEVVDFITGLKR